MLACVNKKMKVRMKNDYKSIALPAELQEHERFCNLILNIIKIFFSLIYMMKNNGCAVRNI